MQELKNTDIGSLPGAPAILLECRQYLSGELMSVVRGMLDQVDDTLFKMADKAENNALQSTYFDAMRLVRMRRSDIEQSYESFLHGESDQAAAVSEPELAGGMSLLETDELEVDLAVHSMVRKVEDVLGAEVIQLDRRIAEVLDAEGKHRQPNPIGPHAVCQAFANQCRGMGSDIEITLLILKLFDQQVVVYLPGLYQELNQLLVRHGILPNLSIEAAVEHPRPQAPTVRVAKAEEPYPSTNPEQPAEQDLFGTLQALMMRSGMAGGQGPAAGAGGGYGGGYGGGFGGGFGAGSSAGAGGGAGGAGRGGSGALQFPQQLLSSLTRIQQGVVTPDDEQYTLIAPELVASGTVNVVRELRGSELVRDMAAVDQVTIDIVAMIFDYVLGDDNLPDSMRALIGRLQIPVLKVAIFDKEFFAHRNHPARRLLNRLADAAAGCNDKNRDDERLLQEVERIVVGILEDFEDDISVFAEYLQQFEMFLSSEAQQARTQTEEVVKVIHGREKLQLAKEAAAREISQRLQRQVCPLQIRKLFKEHLQELLVLHFMQKGTDSTAWRNALKLIDALLWSITPKKHADERKKLLNMLPKLLPLLGRSLTLTALPKEEQEVIFTELSSLHAEAVRVEDADGKGLAELLDKRLYAVEAPPEDKAEPAGGVETGLAEEESESLAYQAMRNAIVKANRQVFETAEARPQCKGMGTTLVALLLRDNQAILGYVGDSRIYRFRAGSLEQLTRDHSLVQELIDKGFFTPEEALDYPNRNVVTRMVGVDAAVRPGMLKTEVQIGDLFLLCSDGLTDLVTDQRIAEILDADAARLNQAAIKLVEEANKNGGKDNISVILARMLADCSAVSGSMPLPANALESVALTDTGLKRAHNEDYVSDECKYGVMLLADGMGGANAGEVASAIAVETMLEQLGIPQAAGETEAGEPQQDAMDVFNLEADEDAGGGREDIVLSSISVGEVEAPVEDEYMGMVRGLKVGDWMELQQQDQSRVKVRLTWVSSATGNYLFTNRRGIKVMEATPAGLAIEFKRGGASLLKQVPLLDRAVSSLTEKLGALDAGYPRDEVQ